MKKLVIDKEQYNEGYRCNPYIKLGHTEIYYHIEPYKLIEKINENRYVVVDPMSFNDD